MNPKYEEFMRNNSLKLIAADEIVFDIDNREVGFHGINFIGINLYKAGYRFEIWRAEGQKSPHLHVKDIQGLESLELEQLKKYKELFIRKYTPKEYLKFADFTLCGKHLIAEENKRHFKYKTTKKLCATWNETKENYVDPTLLKEATQQSQIRKVKITSGVTSKIIQKFSIIEIAKKITTVEGNMGLCPFHEDNKPSLSLNDSDGLFHCFGCRVGGNIVDFLYLIKTKLKMPIENVI